MAKKTTTKSKPEVAAKRAIKSEEKPKAAAAPPLKAVAVPAPVAPVESKPVKSAATPPFKAVPAPPPAPVELKPAKTPPKAKRVVKKTPSPAKLPVLSQEDVALRAYFISEKRRSQNLPGDEHQDWLEAERQIIAETTKRKTAKKA